MTDALKIAAKTALIVTIMAGVAFILNSVQIPTVGNELFRQGIGHAKAIAAYYGTGTLNTLFTIGISLLILKYVALPLWSITAIAIRWIMKVNE